MKRPKRYLNNEDLHLEILKSKESNQLTKKCEDMLILLAQKMITKFKYYKNTDDKKDCLQNSIYVLLKNWHNYDENKTTNAFAYFSEIIKRAMAQGFNELYSNKGDSDKKAVNISIQSSNDGAGIYSM